MSKHRVLIILFISIVIIVTIKYVFAWEFILEGEVRETFDDNIESTVETVFEKKKYDFITGMILGLGVRNEGKTYTLDIIGHVRQQIFARHFDLTNNNQDITVNLNKAFSELISFTINDSFHHYPEAERFEDLFGNVQGRTWYWSNNFGLNGILEVNKYYMISINYTNQFSKYFYTRTRQYYLNNYFYSNYSNQNLEYSFTQTARMQHEFHWDSSNNIYIFYEYQWTEQNLNGIFQTHRPGIGYHHDFTRQLFVEVRISPDIVLPPHDIRTLYSVYGIQMLISPQELYYITLYTYAALSNDVDEQTNATLSFTYQNSIIANSADTTTNWQIAGDVTRQLLDRLSFTSSIFYGQAYFYASRSTNRLFGFSLSIAYEFTEYVSGSIGYDFTLNNMHQDGYGLFRGYVWYNGAYIRENSGYLRNRATIGITAEL